MNQYCGWLGETSTEVTGGIDYHPDAVIPDAIPGDVNGDGEVTIADVNTIIGIILGHIDNTPAADVNSDGEVTVGDVNMVIFYIMY